MRETVRVWQETETTIEKDWYLTEVEECSKGVNMITSQKISDNEKKEVEDKA